MLWVVITFVLWIPIKAIMLLFEGLFCLIGFALKLAAKVLMYALALLKVIFDKLI